MENEHPFPTGRGHSGHIAGRKVLHLDRGREMRGGQHQALLLMQGLQALGVEQVLLARPRAPLAAAASACGIPVFELGYGTLRTFGDWAQITHAHDADSHIRAAIAECRPLVVARRVAFPIAPGVLSRWKYRNAEIYIAVSKSVANILTEYGVDAAKVRTVYDGVPALPSPLERRDVVALESNDDGKCNGLIREAAALGGFDVSFARDLPQAFRYAKLFLYPSRAEGFGSAAVLAMTAGIPVIATRLPVFEEVFGGEQPGCLVENDPTALASAVRHFIDNDTLAISAGTIGRERVAPRFTVEKMVSGTLAVYEELW